MDLYIKAPAVRACISFSSRLITTISRVKYNWNEKSPCIVYNNPPMYAHET
jgi:hypothetical protein